MKEFIRVRAAGGLGNQLLQYFGALFLSQELDVGIRFDLSEVDKKHTNGNYDIRSFIEPNQNLSLENYSKFSFHYICLRILRKSARLSPNNPILLVLEENRSDIRCLIREIKMKSTISQRVEVRGWFANFDYYGELPDSLRKLNLVSKSNKFLQYSENLFGKDYVALHFRFGDYMNNPSAYGVLTREYYEEALSALSVSLENDNIVIFSNENSRISEFMDISKIENLTIVEDDPNFDPAEVLTLMSGASKIITSNSTFSYIAGLISATNSKVVFPLFDVRGQAFISNPPKKWIGITPRWL